MKPYFVVILFILLPIFGCAPSTETLLLQGDIPTPEELAFAVFHSGIYQDFTAAVTTFRDSEISFTSEDLQAWTSTTEVTEDQLIDYMVKYSDLTKVQLTGFLTTTKDIEQRLLSRFGNPLQEVYADEVLLERYISTFKDLMSKQVLTVGEKMYTACGTDYSLACPGTRECYYANDLDSYLKDCEQIAYDNAWIFFQAASITSTAAGAAIGTLAAGVGAGPGAVAGALGGAAAGAIGAIITVSNAVPRCRLELADYCALCRARCVEP